MAICRYSHTSGRGNPIWGNWTCVNGIEDQIVRFCRKAFKDSYQDMWIDPEYFDDKYFRWTNTFFKEVGVRLYPKLTKLPRHRPANYDLDEWRAYVWDVVHRDIAKNERLGVKHIMVVVRGVRILDEKAEDGYAEKITQVKRVTRL